MAKYSATPITNVRAAAFGGGVAVDFRIAPVSS